MKVLVAIDSFKGSLTSSELADMTEFGIKNVFPQAEVVKVPIADGGEGTVESLVKGTHGQLIHLEVANPLMVPVKASYGILGDGKTAVIEMAAASGLTLIDEAQRDPMETSTYGTGELIKDALSRGCREFIIGLGGSATNDGGMGMMQALGVKFLDENHEELSHGGKMLEKVNTIDMSGLAKEAKASTFLIACDVDNPFCGSNGAAHIFAKQKGASPEMILKLDAGLEHFAKVIHDVVNINVANIPGSGAAGGLGGGFLAFLPSKLRSGIDIVLEKLELEKKLEGVDFVITGEGRMDAQSAMGKAPVGIAKLAKSKQLPVIAIAGSLSDDANQLHDHGIDCMFSIITHPLTLKEAMDPDNAKILVQKKTEEIFRLIKVSKKI